MNKSILNFKPKKEITEERKKYLIDRYSNLDITEEILINNDLLELKELDDGY